MTGDRSDFLLRKLLGQSGMPLPNQEDNNPNHKSKKGHSDGDDNVCTRINFKYIFVIRMVGRGIKYITLVRP